MCCMQCLAGTKRWALLLTEKSCKATFFITPLYCCTRVPVRPLPAMTAGATRLKSSISNIFSWPAWTSESNNMVFSSTINKIWFINNKREWALHLLESCINAKNASHSTWKTWFYQCCYSITKLLEVLQVLRSWCSEVLLIRSSEELAGYSKISSVVRWQ